MPLAPPLALTAGRIPPHHDRPQRGSRAAERHDCQLLPQVCRQVWNGCLCRNWGMLCACSCYTNTNVPIGYTAYPGVCSARSTFSVYHALHGVMTLVTNVHPDISAPIFSCCHQPTLFLAPAPFTYLGISCRIRRHASTCCNCYQRQLRWAVAGTTAVRR